MDRKATERTVYAEEKDTEAVEDGPDSADMEEETGMCMTQESTGASHY